MRDYQIILFALVLSVVSANIYILPVDGDFSKLHFYYTTIFVGSPPRPYTVVIDTGSSDFLIPVQGCTTCVGDPSSFYCPSCSATSSRIACDNKQFTCNTNCTDSTCHFVDTYGGLAEYAEGMADFLSLPSGPRTRAFFGSVYQIQMGNNTFSEKDLRSSDKGYPVGLWGFAYQNLSAFNAPTFIDMLVANGIIADIFSMCFNKKGGALVLGGVYPGYENISYVPMPYETYYTFTTLDFTANGVSVSDGPSAFDPRYSIVDSGTALPTVPTPVYAALRKLLMANCSANPLVGICTGVQAQNETLFDGFCFRMSDEQLAQFPTLQYVLQGESNSTVLLSLPPSSYIKNQYFCEQKNQVGLGLEADPKYTIIGAPMMQDYLTIFDRQNKRIGFANKLKCSA